MMSLHSFLKKIEDNNVKKGLYYSVLDGIVWAVMFGLAENYIVPFALVFGASVFQISLIQGFGQLGTGIAQLAGARFLHHFRKRKRLSITCNIIHSLSWVFVFAVTVLTKNPWFVVLFYALGTGASNFGGPGWLSWMNDLMPGKYRGEYWGLRNRIMGIAQFIAISLAGITLFLAKRFGYEIFAYGLLFIAGFVFRFSSIFFLEKQYEPPMKITEESHTFKFTTFLQKLTTTNFGRFVLYIVLISFSANILGSILPAYILKRLQFNYLQFTVVMMIGVIASFIFMTYWGPLSDKYGNYRILVISSFSLPLLALAWVLIRNFYLIILLQIFGGFIWAGVNLATSNFIFDAVRRENISKIMSYFNMLNGLGIFIGSASGGLISDWLLKHNFEFGILNGFTTVFFISAVLRLIIVAFGRKAFKEVRETEVSPKIHFFYIYKPAFDVMSFIQDINKRLSRKKLT